MERFDIRTDDRCGWELKKRDDGLGMFVYAESALWYQRKYAREVAISCALTMVCVALAAYLVIHKHDPQPAAKPEVSAEEYQQAIQLAERKEAEKLLLQAKLVGEQSRRKLSDYMIKTLNANNAKLIKQLEELQVSVPTQPIIMEAIRKEAATPQGFRQAVDRAFGNGMGARIKVVNE